MTNDNTPFWPWPVLVSIEFLVYTRSEGAVYNNNHDHTIVICRGTHSTKEVEVQKYTIKLNMFGEEYSIIRLYQQWSP